MHMHLAGAVGAALADRLMVLRWIARNHDSRALTTTPIGWANIERIFGCSLHDHTVRQRSALRVVAGWPLILGFAAARKPVHDGARFGKARLKTAGRDLGRVYSDAPPQIAISCPVIAAASSESKKATSAATSSG